MNVSRPDEIKRSTLVALLIAIAVVAVAVAVWRQQRPAPVSSPNSPTAGDFTIAFTGDTIVTNAVEERTTDTGFESVAALLRQATIAVTNLEMTLFERPPAATLEPIGWPYGAAAEATALARTGFDVVSRANNRAADYGAAGLEQTGFVLDAAGMRHVGAGRTLAERAPRSLVNPARGGWFFSVSASATPKSRATEGRGEIAGRPGINSLRFSADITVDEKTFATLKTYAPSLQADARVTDQELTLFGRTIKKGDQTFVASRWTRAMSRPSSRHRGGTQCCADRHPSPCTATSRATTANSQLTSCVRSLRGRSSAARRS